MQRFRYVSNPILFLKWVIHIWRIQCYGCLHGSLSISMRVCKCVCRNLFFGYYINFHCGWIIIIIKLDCESNIIDGFCEQKSKQIRAFVCTQTAFRFYFHRICFFVTTVGWMPFLFVSFNSMSSNEYVRIFFTKPLTPHRIKSRSLNRIKSRRRAPTTETRSSRLFSKKKCCAYLDFVALIFCLGGSLKPLYFPSLVRFLQSQGCFAGVETEYMAQMKQKDGKHFFILNRRNNRMNKQKKNPSPLEPFFFTYYPYDIQQSGSIGLSAYNLKQYVQIEVHLYSVRVCTTSRLNYGFYLKVLLQCCCCCWRWWLSNRIVLLRYSEHDGST